jgi:hypothetical protein
VIERRGAGHRFALQRIAQQRVREHAPRAVHLGDQDGIVQIGNQPEHVRLGHVEEPRLRARGARVAADAVPSRLERRELREIDAEIALLVGGGTPLSTDQVYGDFDLWALRVAQEAEVATQVAPPRLIDGRGGAIFTRDDPAFDRAGALTDVRGIQDDRILRDGDAHEQQEQQRSPRKHGAHDMRGAPG